MLKLRYAAYPQVWRLMQDRDIRYNEQLKFLSQMEKDGKAFVIRPQEKSDTKRIDKNPEHLKNLYNEGYTEAERNYEKLVEYFGL